MVADELTLIGTGWRLARADPGSLAGPIGLEALHWVPAAVPGTVAGALRSAGLPLPDDLDAHDWWLRTEFDAEELAPGERAQLLLDGLATVAEVYLNGARVLTSESMFLAHVIEIGERLAVANELVLCFRALTPLLAASRRPRARWRTRLVARGNLRFHRTMLLGRAPGFAPGPAVVGPWRPVALRLRRGPALRDVRLHTSLRERDGLVEVSATVDGLGAGAGAGDLELAVEIDGPTGGQRAVLRDVRDVADGIRATGTIVVPRPALWWPHTHGEPNRYRVTVTARVDAAVVDRAERIVAFRALSFAADVERDGLRLHVNGVPVFARGAVWVPPDLDDPGGGEGEVAGRLRLARDAGMNMLRVPGTACYESDRFYELCDELGILVWQDFMFANMDYPEADPDFMAAVELEARQFLDRVWWRPSLAVLCGSSEVAQQAAMLGLDPAAAQGPLYRELLPRVVAQTGTDAAYLPSTPWGGDLPFRPGAGVAHYYGVGAYLRPLEDARRSQVTFAAECLAFSNVPDNAPSEPVGSEGLGPQHPSWKAGVPRDAGAGWDFEDVRDHYLKLLFGVDPAQLRSHDIDRYLELGRVATAEVMAEVFGEWRRRESPCSGALVLWMGDLLPGAGWGLLDHRGRPKLVYHHLRRALAPIAVWTTDEGLGGVVAHIANDRAEPLQARLRVALYREREVLVAEAGTDIQLGPHVGCEHNIEQLLGHFSDVSWSYRFGPPAQDLIVLSLERCDERGSGPLSQAFRLPAGRPLNAERASSLGLTAGAQRSADDRWTLWLSATRFVYGCRIRVPGFTPGDDGFSLEPGRTRRLDLNPTDATGEPVGELTAVNLAGRVTIAPEMPG